MTIAANKANFQIVDADGSPLPRIPRIHIEEQDALRKLATILRSLATFQTVRSLIDYQFLSPLPAAWFSVRMFNKTRPSTSTAPKLEFSHGDVLSYVIANHTDSLPVYVHMLSLNASWTIGTLLWNIRIPPQEERAGDLTMMVPRRANDDDPMEVEDTIVVIFCVGEQCTERLATPSEWLKGVYLPPVLLEPGAEGGEVPVWPLFVPPPNWTVRAFTVRTVQRHQLGAGGNWGMRATWPLETAPKKGVDSFEQPTG